MCVRSSHHRELDWKRLSLSRFCDHRNHAGSTNKAVCLDRAPCGVVHRCSEFRCSDDPLAWRSQDGNPPLKPLMYCHGCRDLNLTCGLRHRTEAPHLSRHIGGGAMEHLHHVIFGMKPLVMLCSASRIHNLEVHFISQFHTRRSS